MKTYTKDFDEHCTGWTNQNEMNKLFLLHQQYYATSLLRSRGYLFLNEVYDMLGMPCTRSGQVAGWVYSEESDVFVDFGLYNEINNSDGARATGVFQLTFKVHENILDCLEEE